MWIINKVLLLLLLLYSHVGKLPKLMVGDALHHPGILYDPGVRHQKAVHIGPVFIQVGIHRTGHDRAGNVRAASAEGSDGVVGFT